MWWWGQSGIQESLEEGFKPADPRLLRGRYSEKHPSAEMEQAVWTKREAWTLRARLSTYWL